MRKMQRQAVLGTVTTELSKVKGGTDPNPPGTTTPPLDDPDCRTHIVDLG